MKLIFISFLVFFITKIYCKLPEYHPEQIVLLILSAGSWHNSYEENDFIGNIVKDKEGNPLTINIKNDKESEEFTSIVDIIPSLQNLEPDELEKKFSKLYKLAFAIFYNTFEIEGKNKIILNVQYIQQTISDYNFVNALITPEDINILHDRKYQSYLYISSDNDKDNSLKELIKSFESKDISNIDINQFDDLPDDIKGKWKDDESVPKLYKAISIQCAKIEDCINQFQYENEQSLNDISFNIVRYSYNDGNTYNYAFIVINDKSKNVYHAFTLEADEKEKFTLNEKDSTYNSVSYEYINEYYIINSEKIKKRKENEIVVEMGIGLLAECGLIYEDEQYIYVPGYYGYLNDDTDLDDEELEREIKKLNEKIFQLYHMKEDEGTYNPNVLINIFNLDLIPVNPVEDTENDRISFVKSKSEYDNILCSYTNDQLAHIEELALRFLKKRKSYVTSHNEDINESYISEINDSSSSKNIELLPYTELYVINKLYEVIALKKMVTYDGSIFHNRNNFELINDYEEYVITQDILFKIDSNMNKCNTENKCSINLPLFIDFDIESSFNRFMNYGSNDINLDKGQLENGNTYRTTIQNPQDINENFKSVTDAILYQTSFLENNINRLSYLESSNSLLDLYRMINGIKIMYVRTEYKNNPNLKYITEKDITHLEALYEKARSIHNDNFRDYFIVPRNFIIDYDSIKQPNSKYTYDKIGDILMAVNELIKFNDPDDDGAEIRMQFDVNGRILNIEDTINRLQQLEISENLKEHYKPYILFLCNTATHLEDIFDKVNSLNTDHANNDVVNSRVVYGLKDAIHDFAKRNYPNDAEIADLVYNHILLKFNNNYHKYDQQTYNIDRTTINYNDICKLNVIDIFNDPRAVKYINIFFDRFKYEVLLFLNDNNFELPDNVKSTIYDMREAILGAIERFENNNNGQNNDNDNIDGHIEEAIHIPALINGFNELVILLNEYQINDIRGLYLEDYPNLETKLHYIGLELQYRAIDQVIKENPTMFRLPNGVDSFKNYIIRVKTDFNNEFIYNEETFGDERNFYFQSSDIENILIGSENSNIMKKNFNDKSLSDIVSIFNSLVRSNDHKIGLERCSNLEYHILKNYPTIKRDETDIKIMESSRLFNNRYIIKGNSINPMESSETTYERLKENAIYSFNMFEYNRMLTDYGYDNEERESMLSNFKSTDDIIYSIEHIDIDYDNNNNIRIISINDGTYKFIRPNEKIYDNGLTDDVEDIDLFTIMSNDLQKFNDNSKYSENSKNGIILIDNKNRIELINNCDRLTGGIFQAYTKLYDGFHSACHGVTEASDEQYYKSSEKANIINDINKINKNLNENFLNSVDCVEKIGGKSFIIFNNLNEFKDYEKSFTAIGVDPYRPTRNTNMIHNQNNNNNTGNHKQRTGGNHHH